jgi:histidine triad (HIT) family protein
VRDIDPKAPVHVIVMPRDHIESLSVLDDPDLAGHLVRLCHAVAAAEGVAESGYRVVVNTGADGGQSVGHLHFHVLGGRPLAWPPG